MKYRFTVNGFNRFFSTKWYTIVWVFEILLLLFQQWVTFKKWLIHYINKINRKCSTTNEKIYYWLQVALVYAWYMECRTQDTSRSRRLYATLVPTGHFVDVAYKRHPKRKELKLA